MPTRRVTDTAGQIEPETVEPGEAPASYFPETPASEPAPEFSSEPTASDANAGFSDEQTAAVQRLRRLGSRRAVVRAELERVEAELLGEAILEAFRLKVPKRVIAKESQVVRQTVYNVIERA